MIHQVFELERDIGVALVTPDMQACIYLYTNGPSPSHHLQAALRTSPAGFHNVKRRLKEQGIIIGRKCPADARVTLYDLSDHIRRIMDLRLRAKPEGAPALKFGARSNGHGPGHQAI